MPTTRHAQLRTSQEVLTIRADDGHMTTSIAEALADSGEHILVLNLSPRPSEGLWRVGACPQE